MKPVLLALVAILFLAVPTASQESLPELAHRLKPSVVTVIAIGKEKQHTPVGSGFFVAQTCSPRKLTIEDVAAFAKRIRQKTGAYYDKSDVELVRRVLEKYPEYRRNVTVPISTKDRAPSITRNDRMTSGTLIITNWHVVKDAKSLAIKTLNERTFNVTSVVAFSVAGDIALLRTNAPREYPSLEVADTFPEAGERVFVIGNPLGLLEGSVSDGIVSAIRVFPTIGDVLQITAPISPGNSGSPVFDMDGHVAGVAAFGIMAGQNLNFAMSIRLLERILCPDDPMGLSLAR
jgi:S1-C subfamily serine protease